MARYYLRIQQGQFSGVSDLGPDFSDDRAAWEELANVGSDLLVGIARKLKRQLADRAFGRGQESQIQAQSGRGNVRQIISALLAIPTMLKKPRRQSDSAADDPTAADPNTVSDAAP